MKIVLGTRGSALATAQSGLIADWIRRQGHDVEIREFKTTGDWISELHQPIEGKGDFHERAGRGPASTGASTSPSTA